jgi:predicted kinase
MPIFLSVRAAIRSKVIAAGLAHLSGTDQERMAKQAQQYFRATEGFLKLQPPRLIAVAGLSGSGKTTLAAKIAPQIGTAPGAIHLRSDIERKVIAGVAETERLPPDAYTLNSTAEVYASLRLKAELALAAGYSVIVDAVHASPAEREQIEAAASHADVPFFGLWLDAPSEVLMERVRTRMGDASDAMESVVEKQLHYDLGEIAWPRVDATIEMEERIERALTLVAR